MSLVGTRPILPDELEQYELHHRARIAIKPGITGMWQVSGRSDITDFEEIVRLDTEYISEWNIGLDPLDENNEKVLVFKKKYGLDGKFVIMYSGNIGLYYDLENLIKVVEKIKVGTKTTDGREVVFAFVGAGSVLDKLVLYVKEHHMDNVTFIPYQDKP